MEEQLAEPPVGFGGSVLQVTAVEASNTTVNSSMKQQPHGQDKVACRS